MTIWQTIIELILVALLAAMLSRLIRLERVMRAGGKDRLEIDRLLQDFDRSTQYARDGLAELRETATNIGIEVSKKIVIAKDLEKDLVGLFQLGDALATRLQGLVSSEIEVERSRADVAVTSSYGIESRPPSIRSKAEQDLLRALRAPR